MSRNRKNKSRTLKQNQPGIIKRHPDGFGFFIPDDSELPDVYIPKRSMEGIMTGDRVRVDIYPEKGGDRFRGSINEIISRGFDVVVGPVRKIRPDAGLIQDEANAWGFDLIVKLDPRKPFKDGDWAAVQITSYPDEAKGFQGKILELIGEGEDPANDALRVLFSHGIAKDFSEESRLQAERLPEEVVVPEGRRDLRDIPLVTIDGKTAKDFDDAICVAQDHKGFLLYVAIADVSHYVKPGSPLDREAFQRGNSTYFPNFVAPMLPEKLSENLCSLRPDVDRLAMVAEMRLNFAGELLSSQFYEAVIKSHARLTYGEAQEIFEGAETQLSDEIEGMMLVAQDLAKILMAKRFREGSLSMEIPETEVEIDAAGHVVDIFQSQRLFAHKLIEEFMLQANVAVAKFLSNKLEFSLYRVHEPPNPDALDKLETFMRNFGYSKKISGGALQKKLSRALEQFAGTEKEQILNMLTLRSMAQAKYSEENIGHFGLGFSFYTHFTSPIRRYADLVIHRLLKSVVCPESDYRSLREQDLANIGVHTSATEQRSVKAERQIKAIKKARFMEQFLGEEFEAQITSAVKYGVFATLRQYEVDGLIRIEELPGGPFEFDEEHLCLRGKRSGIRYAVGDSIKIQVAAVDKGIGQVDFVFAGEGKLNSAHQNKKQSAKGRRKAKNHRGGVRKARISKRRRKS